MLRQISLVAAFLSCAAPGLAVAGPTIGDVTKVELNAYGTPPADSRRELFLGNPVVEDELIETVLGGGASITFADGSQLHLGSGSQASLDSFVYDPGKGTGVVELGQGVFRFIGSGGGRENIEIVTPDAVIGIRGTDVVIVNAAGRKTVVGLASGSVAVQSRTTGKSAVAAPGQMVLIDPNSADVVLRDAPVKPEDLICWVSRDPYICSAGVTSAAAAPATGQTDALSGGETAAVSESASTGGGSTGGGSTGGGSTGGGSTGGGSSGGDTGSDSDNGHGNDVAGVDPSNPGTPGGPPGQTGAEPPGQSGDGPGNASGN